MKRFHGILSLVLFLAAVALGFYSIMRQSVLFGILDIAIFIIGFAFIIYSYCAKCPCRLHSCGHVLPGLITRLLPPRKEGKYSIAEITAVMVSGVIIAGFPVYWLFQTPLFLIIYVIIFIITCADIVLFVCTKCENRFCPLHPKK